MGEPTPEDYPLPCEACCGSLPAALSAEYTPFGLPTMNAALWQNPTNRCLFVGNILGDDPGDIHISFCIGGNRVAWLVEIPSLGILEPGSKPFDVCSEGGDTGDAGGFLAWYALPPADPYILAIGYALNNLPDGKYEPDHRTGESLRTLLLANWRDKTNILVQYHPDELSPP